MSDLITSPAWLPRGARVRYVACGRAFDAVQVDTLTGSLLLKYLPVSAGPVVIDCVQDTVAWLIAPRAADGWQLAGVRVLGAGCVLSVPPATFIGGLWTAGPAVRWLTPPTGNCLTSPRRLRNALAACRPGLVRRGHGAH